MQCFKSMRLPACQGGLSLQLRSQLQTTYRRSPVCRTTRARRSQLFAMPKPRCSVFIATSLDGFIAKPDGDISWLDAVQLEGEDYGSKDFHSTVDTLIMGRNTYDVVAGFNEWPYSDKERVIVLTHREAPSLPGSSNDTTTKHPNNVQFRSADNVRVLVEQLAQEGAKHVYVDGGAVIRQFLAAHLIDNITLSIIPVVLGDGIPLFGAGMLQQQQLVLESTRSWPATGLVQLRYRLEV